MEHPFLMFLDHTQRRSTQDLSRRAVCGRSPAEIVGSNPTGGMDVCCCKCCVLLGRGLCDELITHPEESYRLWCVVLCELETSRMRRPWHALGRRATGKKKDGWYQKSGLLYERCGNVTFVIVNLVKSLSFKKCWITRLKNSINWLTG